MGANVSVARVDDANTMRVMGGSPIVFTDEFNGVLWGNNTDICVPGEECPFLEYGSLVRDLGRRINFYLDDNTLLSTFRQIQLIAGAGSEGVDDASTVEPWRVGWMLTFLASPSGWPGVTDNSARSTRESTLENIRAVLKAYKGRIYMDSGVGTIRRLVKA